ncbi:MAG: phosphoadenylyl-sulfate reductase [Anaerolineae bacterium]
MSVIALDQIKALNQQFEHTSPQEVLAWVAQTYPDHYAVVTSFQPTGIITLHMLSETVPNVPVLTLDTDLLFPQTYALIDAIEARLNLQVVRVRSAMTLEAQADAYGDALWETNPDLCCRLRKVEPLRAALAHYDAWITGLRRDQGTSRRNTPVVSWDEKYQNVKVSPFATWTEEMVWTYIYAHNLPYNTLHDQGYPSIGCRTCTKAVIPGGESRSGRWANYAKTECGIHVPDELPTGSG